MKIRFEETNLQSGSCDSETQECIGGYARIVSKLKELKETKKDLNPIYLNAGDNFQGTLWYNFGRWNVTNQFLNMYPADVQTIGNHEFDHDIEGVVPYLKNTLTPTVIANVDDSDETTFQSTYNKSIVIERSGRKIGVIGVILSTTNNIAKTGNLRFTRESDAVRAEATKLKSDGVNIIIVLSHCGIDVDRSIATYGGPDIDIIVGGHSHSFLWSGSDWPSSDKPVGNYPIIVNQTEGHRVLIVQASAYTKYLGDITLYFDDEGIIQNYEGKPHFMAASVPQDEEVVAAIQPWKVEIDKSGKEVMGTINYEASSRSCYVQECLMGTLQAESMLYSIMDWETEDGTWAYATMSFTNPGGVRGTLAKGKITYNDLVTTTPFENTVEVFEVQGKYIREMLESSVRRSGLDILQMAGVKVVFKLSNPSFQRVVSVDVLCRFCSVPKYEPLEDETWYRIVINGFLLVNGDNFKMLRDNLRSKKIVGVDLEALKNYVQKNSPITSTSPYGRISFI